LIGAVISGTHFKVQDFHHKLLVSFLKVGEKTQGNSMIKFWPSDSGVFGKQCCNPFQTTESKVVNYLSFLFKKGS
jgi:hypothetical protein